MKKSFAVVLFLMTAAAALAGEEPQRRVFVYGGDGPLMGKRAFIGIGLTSLTPELREFFGAPRDAGVLVGSVTANSPAAKAGLKVGDVIVAVDGKSVEGAFDLNQAMRDKHSGDSVRIEVVRNKARQTMVATAEERDVREFRRAFSLGDMENHLKEMDSAEWRALVATPQTDDLRARIRELEIRLQELEKKLQQK